MRSFISYLKDESGASAAEYALILAIIAALIIGAVTFLGDSISGAFRTVGGEITAG